MEGIKYVAGLLAAFSSAKRRDGNRTMEHSIPVKETRQKKSEERKRNGVRYFEKFRDMEVRIMVINGAVQKVRVTDFLKPLLFFSFFIKKVHKKIVPSCKMKVPPQHFRKDDFYEQSNDY